MHVTLENGFLNRLEKKVLQQLSSQKVSYLLGAGSSYLDQNGYPLSSELWAQIKNNIPDSNSRNDIQKKLDQGANGIEHALDLLDDGSIDDTKYRHLVIEALSELFISISPDLNTHIKFLEQLHKRGEIHQKIFSLNYDPLIERASEIAKIRIVDGFYGMEEAFFAPQLFEERIGKISGSFKGNYFSEMDKPIQLIKLHGSLGWYDCPKNGIRRHNYSASIPDGSKRLMVPPQKRKTTDTMFQPYATLWSLFRGSLVHDHNLINRLACFGYSFSDEHVNTVIEAALRRNNFTLLIFSRKLSNNAFSRWSSYSNAIIVTEDRCSLYKEIGEGHTSFWKFESLCSEL